MVGVIAVSAQLEDYTVQPCKKQRRDEEPPSKTITNYFSPLSKTIDKGLSSPRSSSIADYFIRSPLATSKERTPSSKTTSPVFVAKNRESPSTPLSSISKQGSKIAKRGKRTRLIKRLSDAAPPSKPGSENPANSGITGSDTAALLAEICSQTQDLASDEDDVIFQSETCTAESRTKPQRGQCLKRRTRGEVELQDSGQPVGPSNKPPAVKSVSSESKSSVGGTSLEVHADNSSDNLGTLTISFEDFMKSQEEHNQSISESRPVDQSDVTDATGGDPDVVLLSSPKTVTVQAQVHLSPPLPSQNSTKIASIFTKNKVDKKKVDLLECEQLSPVGHKRKSNVVIPEEDLELAVIDVENSEPQKQKSSTAERQQFMRAFRQAGDSSKPSAKKNLARRKDLKEGTEGHSKLNAEEQPSDQPIIEENKAEEMAKASKLRRKKKPKPPTPRIDTPKSPVASESPEQSPLIQSSPGLRRSLRRQKSNLSSKSPERTSVEGPILMSTPKVRTPCRKSDVYKAEVLTVPSDTESPIRMRFTRVTRRSGGRQAGSDDDDTFTPGCKKVSESSKKISKAKQLVEKAKAIQQSIGKLETPQRRSRRQKNRGTQEPVVIKDSTNSRKEEQKMANLRSLNDILGKKVKVAKLPSGQKKEAKRKVDKGGVITIDDGSEVSENSQDDEQFKARREFLMSGLPDSLKRQIAKTTAIMEAYSVSGSSFQTVVHVQQRDGCSMWSLAMPRCRLLTDLTPLESIVPDVTRLLSFGDFTRVNSKSAAQPYPKLVPRSPVYSDVIRDRLLEEIRLHNPQFPVRKFFKQFLRKQSDYLQDANKSALQQSEKSLKLPGDLIAADCSVLREKDSGTKRKRKESPITKCKRRKPATSTGVEDEAQCESAPNSKLSRSSRRKKGGPPAEPDVVIIEEESPVPPAEDVIKEDVLWTEKYQPQNSSELIGNSAAIHRLHSWLKEWKIRAEKEEKRNQLQKTGKDKDDTWDTGDFHNNEDSDEDSLCNTLLISGPPGVGKTAAVYACAQELGFKVFEVNASCQRSGRQILAQLKEATQSHQVDQQGVNAHKPCFFSSLGSTRSPRKLHSPKRVVSSPRKPPVSPRGPGMKKGLAPKSLANFFQKATPKQKHEVRKTNPDLITASQPAQDGKASRTEKGSGSDESQRKTATSLILFEEVDVIFDDDVGFLSAIKTFMSTTKRPVILTTSDPTFGMMFDGSFEEISFHTPSVVNVASFLQVLCLAEHLRTDTKDMITFLTANRCDIRQSVLQLQFWARSGGGGLKEKLLPPPENHNTERTNRSDGTSATDISVNDVPGCNVGCAENLLGVNNIIAPTDSLICFVKEKILEVTHWDKILRLLTEFHSRNVYFTSSNLEFLVPLPIHMEEPTAPAACVNPQTTSLPDNDDGLAEDVDVKPSATMKRRRKLVLLNDSDLFESDSNSLDEALGVVTKQPEEKSVSQSDEVRTEVSAVTIVKRAQSPAELKASALVCQCLDSMAEFADHMSFLDCYTSDTADPAHTCNSNWTGSRLKHGLCDGLRTESRDLWSAQSCGEVRALIEALSFHKCSSRLSNALDSSLELCKQSGKDPTEELTLHVSKIRGQVHFSQLASTIDAGESRQSVVKDVLSHPAFVSLGNRQVNVTDYLPTLRCICRLQKTKEEGKTKRRFLHYLEGIHLELPKATLSSLALDFP
ncbi:ATPase family AAA domain-containing protein 5 [Leptodactylus fuscus]